MTRHDDRVYLKHMRDHIETVASLIDGKCRRDLDSDAALRFAILHLLCIVGEAAAKVSEKSRVRYSAIQWRNIIAMRNRIIHGYESVNLNVIWDTVELDLPPLLKQIKETLQT